MKHLGPKPTKPESLRRYEERVEHNKRVAERNAARGLDPDPPPLTPTPAQRLASIGEMHDRVTAIAENSVEQARQAAEQRQPEPQEARPPVPGMQQLAEASATPEMPEERHAARQREREQREKLESDSWADKVESGWRKLTAEDVARQMSLEYREAAERTAVLKAEKGKAEYDFNRASTDADVFGERIKERHGQLSVVQRLLHDHGWRPDRDLANWERALRGAEGGREKHGIRLKMVQDRLEAAELVAGEALERIRPEAERVLQERQRVAESAREQLREIQEAELRQRQRERQTRRLQL